MASHGLKFDPDRFEERKAIIQGYHKVDAVSGSDAGKKGKPVDKRK